MVKHYERLDTESIWLFVATTGTWGIDVTWVRLFALTLVAYYLFRKIFDKHYLKHKYSDELKEIINEIEKPAIPKDTQDRLLGQLSRVERKYLRSTKAYKLNVKFILSWVFFVISSYYAILDRLA
ncbi:Putative membrane protein [Moritella viscosa]|nr:Putative membrane protein [Moritella viscosa]SHO19265.1 Putative membrane protein [Moritella viscosa]